MSRLWPTVTLDYSAVARLMRRRDLASAPWVRGPTVRGSRGAQELSATPRSKSSKSAKIEKIATLADQHVRCFSGTAVSEAAGLGSSTVCARPGGLLVAGSAGGERGALLNPQSRDFSSVQTRRVERVGDHHQLIAAQNRSRATPTTYTSQPEQLGTV